MTEAVPKPAVSMEPPQLPRVNRSASPARATVRSRPARPSHPHAMINSMARQLALHLETSDDDWRLDEHTREAGRRGVAEARRVLAEVIKRSAA
jgi:hypothetical protein